MLAGSQVLIPLIFYVLQCISLSDNKRTLKRRGLVISLLYKCMQKGIGISGAFLLVVPSIGSYDLGFLTIRVLEFVVNEEKQAGQIWFGKGSSAYSDAV